MYHLLSDLNEGGFRTWVTYVEEMLCDNDMSHIWRDQVCNKAICDQFKTLMLESYSEYGMQCINNTEVNPKLRTYRMFKHSFVMEPYLTNVSDFKIRRQLSRFRMSNHVLHIEKGRHTRPKTPVDKRICTLCKTNQIEDEFHFICVCKVFQDLREDFFCIIKKIGRAHV